MTNNINTGCPLISIVSPVYLGATMVDELVRRCSISVETITNQFEIILVNDASPDTSWDEIIKQCELDSRVKGLNLSRNFGQHYAITAGLSFAKGEWIVVMDCDLQDQPEEIPNLYYKAQEGYDIVYARRIHRQDKWFKRFSSHLFYTIFNWLSGGYTDSSIANFGIYSSAVIEQYNLMPESSRSFGSLIRYIGFPSTSISVQHSQRRTGHSSYTLRKLLNLGLDIIIANSNKPLRMTVILGFGMSGISFILALYNVLAKWTGIISLPGFTTTVFSIWFVGGLLLFVMGILGLYIGKIFNQVKGRQLFIVKDKVNIK